MKGVQVEAVDTTGAGDSFVGGVLNSFASNPNLYKVTGYLFSSCTDKFLLAIYIYILTTFNFCRMKRNYERPSSLQMVVELSQ